MRVATTRVIKLFWDRHIFNQACEMAQSYDSFRGTDTSTMSLVFGMIFEVRIHQLLKKGRRLTLTPIRGHIADGNITYDDDSTTNMSGSRRITLNPLGGAPLTDGITLNPGLYYQPRISNFPTIDSLILYPSVAGQPPILIMFQIAWNVEEHTVKQVRLEKIKQLVIPKNAEKFLVIVTPENVKPKVSVPMTYWTDAFLANRTPDSAFPVFHSGSLGDRYFDPSISMTPTSRSQNLVLVTCAICIPKTLQRLRCNELYEPSPLFAPVNVFYTHGALPPTVEIKPRRPLRPQLDTWGPELTSHSNRHSYLTTQIRRPAREHWNSYTSRG